MSDTNKILVQSTPAAATPTQVLQVNSASKCLLQALTVCNRSAAPTSFRFAITPAGQTLATDDYIYYDLPIEGNDTFMATFEVTLSGGDVITIYATNATLTFMVYGLLE